MKRKIAGIIAALGLLVSLGLYNSTPAPAAENIACGIFYDGPVYIDPSHYYIRGSGTSVCTGYVNSQKVLTVIKKSTSSGWVNVPGTSSGWKYGGPSSTVRAVTGTGYCYGSGSHTFKVEMSHAYNGGPIHYHSGPPVTLSCNA